jgi:hypothetical protein
MIVIIGIFVTMGLWIFLELTYPHNHNDTEGEY